MKKYSSFSVDDFIADEYFQKWVKKPLGENNLSWQNWLLENPEKRKTVEAARDFILKLQIESIYVAEQRIDDLRLRYKKAIAENARISFAEEEEKVVPLYKWYKVAAVFIGFLIASTLLFVVYNNLQTIKHTTAYGETKNIILPDGSSIVLNGNSIISYGKDWQEGKAREVYLQGEAFFSVIHKSSHEKFLVNLSNVTVQVLGTTFDVKQRDKETRVILNSGKVQLFVKKPSEEEKVITMRPGELINIDKETGNHQRKEVNPEVYSSWRNKKLVFDNTSLRNILEALEDDYGLNVEVSDTALLNQKVFGTVPSNSLDSLLINLSHIFKVKIKKENNTIKIK